MKLSNTSYAELSAPRLCSGVPSQSDGRYQVRLSADSSTFAYVTAEEAERLSEGWCDVAAAIREREAAAAAITAASAINEVSVEVSA